MSDANEPLVPQAPATDFRRESSGAEAAKDEAAAVTRTATDAAKDVGQTAKDEATAVMDEGEDQVRELYHQTRAELMDEASKQQQRAASGLQTVGDDLGSMARNSDDSGVAREFVSMASERVNQVATWLGEREPGEMLDEVKRFARRQPGVFIAAAAIAGVLAGRLTRALASGGQDQQETDADTRTPEPQAPMPESPPPSPAPMGGLVMPPSEPMGAMGGAAPEAPLPGAVGGPAPTEPRPGAAPAPDLSREGDADERPYTL